MNSGYWLWPLPPADALRMYVEWLALGVTLSSVELEGAPLVEAATGSQPLWNE